MPSLNGYPIPQIQPKEMPQKSTPFSRNRPLYFDLVRATNTYEMMRNLLPNRYLANEAFKRKCKI